VVRLSTVDHPSAANPSALYTASNAGSFLGVQASPTVLEPTLRLGQQSRLGYVLAAGPTSACEDPSASDERDSRASR
jgi:hypothetical protein